MCDRMTVTIENKYGTNNHSAKATQTYATEIDFDEVNSDTRANTIHNCHCSSSRFLLYRKIVAYVRDSL